MMTTTEDTTATQQPIGVKEAVLAAQKYIRQAYPEGLIGLRLEEVEMSDDERYWYITLGFSRIDEPVPLDAISSIDAMIAGRQTVREYKVFKIDAKTGKVLSMKIRTV